MQNILCKFYKNGYIKFDEINDLVHEFLPAKSNEIKLIHLVHSVEAKELESEILKLNKENNEYLTTVRLVDLKRQIRWFHLNASFHESYYQLKLCESKPLELHKKNFKNESHELFNRTEALAKIGGWEIDLFTNTPLWSDEVYRIHELPTSYQPSMESAINFYAPEARPIVQKAVENAMKTGEGWDLELPFITAKNRNIWVRAKGNVDLEDGVPIRIYGIFQDITAEKKIKDQLRLLALISQKTGNIVIITDEKRKIEWVNESFTRVSGYTIDEVRGKSPGEVLQGPETSRDTVRLMKEQLDKHQGVSNEILNYDKSGNKYWVLAEILPIFDEHNHVTNYIAIQSDITQTKNNEKQLLEAKRRAEEATKAKSLFLATMSHEIRTPMNGILGMTQMLEETELTPNQQDLVSTIEASGQGLLNILNDLLDFSKIEAGKLTIEKTEFNLYKVCHEAVNLLNALADEKNLDTKFQFSDKLSRIFIGDPVRIKQIIVNLYSNAIKFTDKGSVKVVVEPGDTKHNVVIKVIDTGIGIPKDTQKKLFSSFEQADASTTRKYGGTGLGLSICKKLCKMMGGKISLSSEENKGSEFKVKLNLETVKYVHEDNLDNYEKLFFVYDKSGYQTNTLKDFFEGKKYKFMPYDSLDVLSEILPKNLNEKHKALAIFFVNSTFDFPNDCLVFLKKRIANAKSIVIASVGNRGDLQKYQEYGLNGFLTLPINWKKLEPMYQQLTSGTDNLEILTQYNLKNNLNKIEAYNAKKILLVEDNLVNQKVGKMMVSKMGHEVEIAKNGKVAIEMIQKNDYDLILMDCQMPEMDGYTATRELRKMENYKTLPIVALTANAMESDKKLCEECGMDDFISKPIDKKSMEIVLEKWLKVSH